MPMSWGVEGFGFLSSGMEQENEKTYSAVIVDVCVPIACYYSSHD